MLTRFRSFVAERMRRRARWYTFLAEDAWNWRTRPTLSAFRAADNLIRAHRESRRLRAKAIYWLDLERRWVGLGRAGA